MTEEDEDDVSIETALPTIEKHGIGFLESHSLTELLTDDGATIEVQYEGESILSPDGEQVRVTRPQIRHFNTEKTEAAEISMKVSVVVSADHSPMNEGESSDDSTDTESMEATSDDWGLDSTMEEEASG